MNLKSITLLAAFVCFSLALSIQAQQPAPGRNSGSISGRVTVDGRPRAGLVVELLTIDTDGPRRPIAKATTSKTGKYVLTNVEAGTYDVSPSAPMFVVPNQGKSGQSGKSVALEAGENVRGIDFDLVSKGSISGQVRDVSGEPVKGQTVQLILQGEDNYSRHFYSSAPGDHTTSNEGGYRISNVPPGKYIVKVGVPYGLAGNRPGEVSYPETFHPSADEPAKATVVEIASGRETSNVDITVGMPLKLYQIVGQVIAVETGAPVPNVGLEIITTGANGRGSSHGSGAFRSNANGEFRIPNALPGHYVLGAESDRASNTYGDQISFEVTNEDVTGLKIPVHAAATLTGMVTIEGNVDPAVADLLKKVWISAQTLSENMTGSVVTSPINSDGGFRITGIRPGKVNLFSFIVPGGSGALPILRIELNGQEVKDGLNVRSGQDINGLRLVLGAGAGVLRGDVKIEGDPLEGVNLYVMYRSTNGDPQSYYRAELDARRHFVIKNLTPGDYELLIGPMSVEISGERGSRTSNRMPTVRQTVTVRAGTDSEVTLVMTLNPEPPARPQR